MCTRNYLLAEPRISSQGGLSNRTSCPPCVTRSLTRTCIVPYLNEVVCCLAIIPRGNRSRRIGSPPSKSRTEPALRCALPRPPHDRNVDMIVSGDRTHGLNVLVDLRSRLTHISLLPNKTATATKPGMPRRLGAYPASLTQSITYGNGSENPCHEELNEALGTASFFCAPYHSWEKSSVEQVNG